MSEERPRETPSPDSNTAETSSVPPRPEAAPGQGAAPELGAQAAGGVAPRPETDATSSQSTVPGGMGPRPEAAAAIGVGLPGASGVPAPPRGSGPRVPWWLAAVALVVAVGVGIGAGALIWAGQVEVEKVYPPGYHALTPEQYDKCLRDVIVSFDGDDPDPAMRAAAAELRDDERFESVREETRQEAFERFKETFKDQPELVKLARPEALPASVHLVVREGMTGKEVKGQLMRQFEDVEVTVQEWCPPPE